MRQNPGARDGTDTAAGRMDLPSIPEPAISKGLMAVGTFAIKRNGPGGGPEAVSKKGRPVDEVGRCQMLGLKLLSLG